MRALRTTRSRCPDGRTSQWLNTRMTSGASITTHRVRSMLDRTDITIANSHVTLGTIRKTATVKRLRADLADPPFLLYEPVFRRNSATHEMTIIAAAKTRSAAVTTDGSPSGTYPRTVDWKKTRIPSSPKPRRSPAPRSTCGACPPCSLCVVSHQISGLAPTAISACASDHSRRTLRLARPFPDRKSTRQLQSPCNLVCRLLLETKKKLSKKTTSTRS